MGATAWTTGMAAVLILAALGTRPATAADLPRLGDTRAIEAPDIRLFEKWVAVADTRDDWMPGLIGVIAGLGATGRADLVRRVNRLANGRPYLADIDTAGEADHWLAPDRFLERGGDCEDFAIAKYFLLRAAGLPAANLRLVVVGDAAGGPEHVVLLAHDGAAWRLLDDRRDALGGLGHFARGRPLVSFDEDRLWVHTAGRRHWPVMSAGRPDPLPPGPAR